MHWGKQRKKLGSTNQGKEKWFLRKRNWISQSLCKLFHKRSSRCSEQYKSVTAHLIFYRSGVPVFVIIRIQMNPGSQKMNWSTSIIFVIGDSCGYNFTFNEWMRRYPFHHFSFSYFISFLKSKSSFLSLFSLSIKGEPDLLIFSTGLILFFGFTTTKNW